MKDVKERRDWAVGRIENFLAKVKASQDPYEIEANIYVILMTAEMAYNEMHDMNTKGGL